MSASASDWVVTPFRVGLLGTGATIAARLLDFELDAHLTNVLIEPGVAVWYEVPAGQQFWRERFIMVPIGARFPYGLRVSPP